MQYILHIESSHNICSVAFSKNRKLVGVKETSEANKHSQLLSVYVKDLMDDYSIHPESIIAVSISQGPGSYTGLRIGSSLAKGICFGLDIPFIAINSLTAMAHWFAETNRDLLSTDDILCPMIDARRMEVYTSLYTLDLKEVMPVNAKIIDSDSFIKELSSNRMHFFGNGADKCSQTIVSSNAIFHPEFQHSSQGLVQLAWNKFEAKEFSDIAYFEPQYLKDFVTTVSKKSVFK